MHFLHFLFQNDLGSDVNKPLILGSSHNFLTFVSKLPPNAYNMLFYIFFKKYKVVLIIQKSKTKKNSSVE